MDILIIIFLSDLLDNLNYLIEEKHTSDIFKRECCLHVELTLDTGYIKVILLIHSVEI